MVYLKYFLFTLAIISALPGLAILWNEGVHMPKILAVILICITLGTVVIGVSGLLQVNNTKLFILAFGVVVLNISLVAYAVHTVSTSINNKIVDTEVIER